MVDGKPLGEKNPKWLQDDYVKFIRFAQYKIAQNGEGVLGFITNHSYLDNPTFRGMRQSLMNTFDEIYFLDLHGNAKKKEQCPDGSKDENVFDIQQGVAIALFIKRKNPSTQTTVYHADQWGLREDKYKWLTKNDIKTTKWQEISPKSDGYLFIPRDERLLSRYEEYHKVTDIFPLNNVGIVTSRDEFVIDFDKGKLLNRIRVFKHSKGSDEQLYQEANKALQSLLLLSDRDLEKYIQPILYRPFDQSYIFYHDDFIERSRKDVMQHMMKENLGLLTCRQQNKVGFYHALVSENIVESCIVSNKTREISYLFPLYLYHDTGDSIPRRGHKQILMVFDEREKYEVKQPNLNPALVEQLTKDYDKKLTPEEIFYYIYAILYSDTYRTKYTEFLKSDFPRIPFTKDYKLFSTMGKLGQELVELHLMKSSKLNLTNAKFQGKGDNRIKKIVYFDGIEKAVWEYQIGGYQVLDKWLKSHKDRASLSVDEVKHYIKIATAIRETIEIQKKIDKIYNKIEKNTN
jgi:predicted helicase